MKRKLGLVTLVVLKLFSGTDAKADYPFLDIWNLSFDTMGGQEVKVVENWPSGEYLRGPPRELRIYGWGPTVGNPEDHAIEPVGIDNNKTSLSKFFLEAETVQDNVNNCIYLNHWKTDPLNFTRRNFVMRQDPNSPSPHKDPNLYDLLDLTDYFTKSAQINLPGITASTPRTPEIYDKWNLIVSNYADFFMPIPDGRVNWKDFGHMSSYWGRQNCGPENHWCEYSDLNRDENVDMKDVGLFSEEWLYDSNDPNTW